MRTPEDVRKLSHQIPWNKKFVAMLDRSVIRWSGHTRSMVNRSTRSRASWVHHATVIPRRKRNDKQIGNA
jgi:hypothetical protein